MSDAQNNCLVKLPAFQPSSLPAGNKACTGSGIEQMLPTFHSQAQCYAFTDHSSKAVLIHLNV